MDLFAKCFKDTRAEEIQKAGLYPYFHPISSALGTEVMMDGKKLLMIGSNNYLGLVSHPKVKEAAAQAALKYGSGCTGSRFLNGTLDLHLELECRLAKFVKKEAALAFSTGFQTNLGSISALVGKGEYVIADRADHASIVDGCRLAFGKTIKFLHNDTEDLGRILSKLEHDAGKMIVVDGVFSMEGDLVKLPEVAKLAKKHKARLMVDDAHAVGVLGKHGRGTAEHFGLEEEVDLIMGTFSKSFASLGGFIAGQRPVVEYIKHVSRELIFSASMPPAAVAAVIAALDIIESEPERRARLWEITRRMHKEFKLLGFDIGPTETPIVPIYIGADLDAFKFWRALLDEGIFANAIISPAVPPGKALIRTSYTATHTDDQLDFVLETFKKLGKAFGII